MNGAIYIRHQCILHKRNTITERSHLLFRKHRPTGSDRVVLVRGICNIVVYEALFWEANDGCIVSSVTIVGFVFDLLIVLVFSRIVYDGVVMVFCIRSSIFHVSANSLS